MAALVSGNKAFVSVKCEEFLEHIEKYRILKSVSSSRRKLRSLQSAELFCIFRKKNTRVIYFETPNTENCLDRIIRCTQNIL